jgi:hypothetical protein
MGMSVTLQILSHSPPTDALMVFDKIIWRCVVWRNGCAEAGPYHTIRPAEAGAGRYRCPAYKLPDEKVKHHKRSVRTRGLKPLCDCVLICYDTIGWTWSALAPQCVVYGPASARSCRGLLAKKLRGTLTLSAAQ